MSLGSRVVATVTATVVLGSATPSPNPETLAPLDAAWSGMAPSPIATTYGIGTWMGDRAFFQDADSGRSLTYDPVADTWETLPRGPHLGSADAAAIWTGDSVVTVGRPKGRDGLLGGGVFDPIDGTWRSVTPHEVPGDPGAAVWIGHEVVLPILDEYGQTRAIAAYAPATDTWRDLRPPMVAGVAQPAGVVYLYWTGTELLATLQSWPGSGPVRLYALDPATGWIALAPSPLDQDAPTGVWTGDRLLFLGSDPHAPPTTTGAAYYPATDTWTTFDTGCPATTHGAWWTGSLVLGEWYAYEPASGACFAVPTQPGRRRAWAVEVWTGTELLRWSGSRGEETPAWRGGWRLMLGAVRVGSRKSPKPGGSATPAPVAPTAQWGPLAIVEARATLADLGDDGGRLVIDARCVTLRATSGQAEKRSTLVFREGQVHWDAEHKRIHFHNLFGGWVWLEDGDVLRSFDGWDPWTDTDLGLGIPAWVVQPNSACPAQRIQVHEIDKG